MSDSDGGYELDLEQIEGQWLAHVPPLPGCYAVGPDPDSAVARVPQAVAAYLLRMAGQLDNPRPASTAERVAEMIRRWILPDSDGYEVNAFFASDARPLADGELPAYRAALGWTYDDLLAAAAGVPAEDLWRPVAGEWSLGRILTHLSQAEWWYLDRLGLAPAEESPADWREGLELTQRHVLALLPKLAGLTRIAVESGELWSARKMLRRLLYHRQDHTNHLHQFRAELGLPTLA